jgi:hypothetical protein
MNEDLSRAREAQAIRAALQGLRERWPAQLELIGWQAKVAKAKFDAARREGFEVSHALQLCVKQWEA